MKPKDWNESLNHMDPDLLEEYIEIKDKKKPKRPFWIATMAATLALTVGIGMLAGNGILPTNVPNWETIPVTEFTTDPTTAPTQPGQAVTNPPTQAPTNPVVTNPPTQAPSRPVVTNPPTQPPTQLRPVATNPPTARPQDPVVPLTNQISAPVYPRMAQYPKRTDALTDYNFYLAVQEWEKDRMTQYQQPEGYADSLTDYFHKSINQFLQGEGNQVYSPLNAYLAMAMLAETANGNSRQQILDLFGLETIEQLRQQVNDLWNAHYCDDGITNMLLANSLWLDEAYTFKDETAKVLAGRYYASSFSGDLGTDAMNKQLQTWLNQNTGGMLWKQALNTELPEDSAFALASAVYFTASWESKFGEGNTKDGLFRSADAYRKVPFMNKTLRSDYYWAENFSAVRLELTGGNHMWLILPDEGYTTADILAGDDYLQMTLNPASWENKKELEINLSLPKFDVAQQQDLVSGMQAMGVTDVFDCKTSDFTSLTDAPELFVGEIDHAARVKIDEEGCEGAAYTVVMVPGNSLPPKLEKIDFVLDRPFVFVVSSQDDLPLFTGIVNEP